MSLKTLPAALTSKPLTALFTLLALLSGCSEIVLDYCTITILHVRMHGRFFTHAIDLHNQVGKVVTVCQGSMPRSTVSFRCCSEKSDTAVKPVSLKSTPVLLFYRFIGSSLQ